MPMTPDDREYVTALIRAHTVVVSEQIKDQTEHFDNRLNLQDKDIREVRDIGLQTSIRVKSLETTRSGVISAFVMAIVAIIGSVSLWLLNFVHFGGNGRAP